MSQSSRADRMSQSSREMPAELHAGLRRIGFDPDHVIDWRKGDDGQWQAKIGPYAGVAECWVTPLPLSRESKNDYVAIEAQMMGGDLIWAPYEDDRK